MVRTSKSLSCSSRKSKFFRTIVFSRPVTRRCDRLSHDLMSSIAVKGVDKAFFCREETAVGVDKAGQIWKLLFDLMKEMRQCLVL